MENLSFQKAQRKRVKLRIALTGPSGGGKTYTALRLARGIGGRIALIDSEHERSRYYAEEFDFEVCDLRPPFTPERYIAAIDAAEKAGYEVLIVDSASHEWAGKGGILEMHDKLTGNPYTRWAKLTPRHNGFIDKINGSSCHVILTIRGKDVYVLEQDEKGKQIPKKVGVGGEQRSGIEYEMTVSFMLDQMNHAATVQKDNTHLFEKRCEVLTERDGELLREWAEEGKATPPPGHGNNGNGKIKNPIRQSLINEIGRIISNEDVFTEEDRIQIRNEIKHKIGTNEGLTQLKQKLKSLAGGQRRPVEVG